MTLKRGLLQILLAALLLVGQYAALTHGFRHFQQPNQLAQSQQQDESGKQKAPSGLCDFHVAFAEILGAVGSYAQPVMVAAQGYELADVRRFPPHAAEVLAPRSRGPPVLV
jgi:hypothetical protein